MKIRIYVSLLFVGLCMSSAMAQNFQQDYLAAKALFNEGKYGLAREAFKPLIPKKENNPFASYAGFYYAVSSYREGFPALAKDMLLQVKRQHSKWSKIDEVNYWLGQIYLETEAYDQGITILREIKDKKILADAAKLKSYYFHNIEDYDLLVELYRTYPADEALGKAMAKGIAAQPLVNQDHELLNEIIERFKLEPDQFNMVSMSESVFKDSYRVAVLYPFMVRDLVPDDRQKFNQFVLDIYLGIRLAVDSLEKQGVELEIFSYDTKRSEKETAKILEKEELKTMDVIIGPFSSKLTDMVNEFSFTNKINIINPLRTDSEVIGNNPYSFLYHPSNETIGRRTADYVKKNVDDRPGVIIYGEQRTDSVLAFAYQQRMREKGRNIIITKEIKKDDTRKVLDLLLVSDRKLGGAASAHAKRRYRLAPDSISHIFVASRNGLIATKVISAVETRGDSIKVLGPSEWLDLPVINYDVYARQGISLYAPVYINKDTETYEKFRNRYLKEHRVAPTKYAAIGYDLMMLLGSALDKYGKYFQVGWNEEDLLDACLTVGHRFKNTNDNHIVPILHFREDKVGISYEVEDDKYAFEKQ